MGLSVQDTGSRYARLLRNPHEVPRVIGGRRRLPVLFSTHLHKISFRGTHVRCVLPPRPQDTVSLKVAPATTPNELAEQAVRKWLTTHGPEEERISWNEYVLRVSGRLEFLFGEHPLIHYKVSAVQQRPQDDKNTAHGSQVLHFRLHHKLLCPVHEITNTPPTVISLQPPLKISTRCFNPCYCVMSMSSFVV